MPVKELLNGVIEQEELPQVLKKREDKDVGGNNVKEEPGVKGFPPLGGISSFLEDFVPLFANTTRPKKNTEILGMVVEGEEVAITENANKGIT